MWLQCTVHANLSFAKIDQCRSRKGFVHLVLISNSQFLDLVFRVQLFQLATVTVSITKALYMYKKIT